MSPYERFPTREKVASELRKISRGLTPEEKGIVEKLKRLRPDLAPFLNRYPVRVYPKGAIQQTGWHHWEFVNGSPQTVEFFVMETSLRTFEEVVKHEACHAKLLSQLESEYAKIGEGLKESLTDECAREPEFRCEVRQQEIICGAS